MNLHNEVKALLQNKKLWHKNVLGEVKVSIQNILFHCFTAQLLLKLAFWNLACSV